MELEHVEVIHEKCPSDFIDKNWSKRKCYSGEGGQEFMNMVHELEVKDDDVWIVTYLKCGTTWMQELVWLVMHDFDFETAKQVDLLRRSPFMEFDFMVSKDLENAFNSINDLASPRFIKSHLPLPLLPKQLWIKKPKVFYVARNIKDAAVSSYYFFRSMGFGMDKSLNEFMKEYAMNYRKTQLPFDHFVEFYLLRDEPWVFYTSFEKMKSNLRQVIEDVCKFLDKTITEEQMEQMLKHLSFEEMKKNPMVQHSLEVEKAHTIFQLPYESTPFMRKGGVNTYKEVVSKENIELFDKWIREEEIKHNVTMDELLLLNESNSK